MIYSPLTGKAMQLAYAAHHRQVDRAGIPYIFHPYHLAEEMQDELSCCAALLHDVVEDTSVTLAQPEAVFPPEVTEAVRLLTHDRDTPYEDYVRRIAVNPIAKAVKLADIRHNADQSRLCGLAHISPEKQQQLKHKYQEALRMLDAQE